ncbi:CRISPR-associated protein, Cmr5 family [Armatimonadetes bacterium GBS]|jgi:CRISPR-associated protein Cmr5|nr:CRISPR-associated protein, Cmr5 family [Armatimonadetes bacterium GBS]
MQGGDTVKTRAQQDMEQALACVHKVKEESEKVRQIYGGLCHSFPVLVRTCGLCQAIAFSADKAQSDEQARAKAHQLLLEHVAQILGLPHQNLLDEILKADAATYLRHTRRVLSAWVYFKRFAVSILKVQSGGEAE